MVRILLLWLIWRCWRASWPPTFLLLGVPRHLDSWSCLLPSYCESYFVGLFFFWWHCAHELSVSYIFHPLCWYLVLEYELGRVCSLGPSSNVLCQSTEFIGWQQAPCLFVLYRSAWVACSLIAFLYRYPQPPWLGGSCSQFLILTLSIVRILFGTVVAASPLLRIPSYLPCWWWNVQ